MRISKARTFIAVSTFLALCAAPAGARAQDMRTQGDGLDIAEWKVPYEASRPRDPFAAVDADGSGKVWFVGQRTGYLASLDPETGAFEQVALKEGSGPHNLIVGSDGVVWYAGNRTALIGKYDPQTGDITEYPMPDAQARDPHTLIFDSNEENIWFTLQGANMMGKLNVSSGEVTLIDSKTENSRPYGVKLGPEGDIWVALFGTHKLAHIDPGAMALTEFASPREEARLRRLEALEDGTVWYVDYAGGYLGRFDPATEEFTEWAMPQGGDAKPYGMASDRDGRLWMVATGVSPNVFMGFDPVSEEFIMQTAVPSGGGTIRHMHYHEPTGAIWFGADTNTIGRAIVESAN